MRFWGWIENSREVEMDMREMVDKVKRREPLYGVSSLTPYMQGVAARNSRYSQVFMHAIPFFNFVNHNQVTHILLLFLSHSAVGGIGVGRAERRANERSTASIRSSTSGPPRRSWSGRDTKHAGGRGMVLFVEYSGQSTPSTYLCRLELCGRLGPRCDDRYLCIIGRLQRTMTRGLRRVDATEPEADTPSITCHRANVYSHI